MSDGRPGGRSLPVRVVLVGQTGLDLPLRLDPTIELRRVPTAVHAIGEAAEPIAPAGQGGAEVVTVILSPETDPKVDAGDFLQNLRHVRPGARVLRLLSPDESATSAALTPDYDGTIRFGTPPDEIRRLVREIHSQSEAMMAVAQAAAEGVAEASEQIPPVAKQPMAPVVTEVTTTVRVMTKEDVSESEILQAVLVGRDFELPAMDVIRRRTGCCDIAFEKDAGAGAAVGHQGVVYGRLVSGTIAEAELASHAAWLGQWFALRQQQEELREAAFTDDLTGAWNRRYCDRFLGTAIAQAAASRGSVTVLVFDIDNFKQYNDRFGHAAGDDILRETVRLLKSVIRPTDRVCRVGGDEFVVVFHEPQGPREPGSKPPANIGEIAHRFQRQICEHRFPKLAEKAPGTLSISGGLATYPWDGRTAQELIERADQLAMQGKLQGKNAIMFGPGANKVCGRE